MSCYRRMDRDPIPPRVFPVNLHIVTSQPSRQPTQRGRHYLLGISPVAVGCNLYMDLVKGSNTQALETQARMRRLENPSIHVAIPRIFPCIKFYWREQRAKPSAASRRCPSKPSESLFDQHHTRGSDLRPRLHSVHDVHYIGRVLLPP